MQIRNTAVRYKAIRNMVLTCLVASLVPSTHVNTCICSYMWYVRVHVLCTVYMLCPDM